MERMTVFFMSIRTSFRHTILCSYLSYIVQAVVNNFAPLLFLTFQSEFQLSLEKVSLLVTINFGIQLLIDLFSAGFVDKIGYRPCLIVAQSLVAVGLVGLAVFPTLLPNAYCGLLLAIAFYAIGGGLVEVLVSPIVEACPSDCKEGAMSLLHSFYCWGHLFVVLASTAFFTIFGIQNWRVLACIWAVLPALNAVYTSLVPILTLAEENGGESMGLIALCKNGLFWLLMLLMLCSGAAEQAMSQWASAFAEAGLGVSKTVGDLLGPCLFAVTMGTARVLYAKLANRLPIGPAITGCGVLCIISYLLAGLSSNAVLGLIGCGLCGFSVGILWPGSFSTGTKALPRGGTPLFAMMALAGDVGCSGGPTLVGLVSSAAKDNLHVGFLAALIFPVLLILCINLTCRRIKNPAKQA